MAIYPVLLHGKSGEMVACARFAKQEGAANAAMICSLQRAPNHSGGFSAIPDKWVPVLTCPVIRLIRSYRDNTRRFTLYLDTVRAIRYNLHFLILTLSALVLWSAKDLDLPASIVNFRVVHFGLIGLLHALAVVVSLRDRKAVHQIAALCFITLAVAWSIATPIVALWTSFVWYPVSLLLPRGESFFMMIFLHGSAVGALGYWVFVRQFWIRSLRRADLLKTLAVCMAATLLVTVATDAVKARMDFKLQRPENLANGSELLVTVAWWFAFSLSLYWSETRTKVAIRDIAFSIAAFVLALGSVIWFFELSSSPLNRQAQTDAARLGDLKSIAAALHLDWEYAQDKSFDWKAPAALKDVPTALRGVRIADPATETAYEYMPLSGSAYQLCAVFDSDSSAQNAVFTSNGWTFSKGRHCFEVDASKSPY